MTAPTTPTAPTLTPEALKETILSTLATVAPEADMDSLDPEVVFRDQLDIDSMDFLNFILALNKELGIEIPELDYPKLSTLNDCLAYLQAHAGP